MTGEKKKDSAFFKALITFLKKKPYYTLGLAVLVLALAGGIYSIYLAQGQMAQKGLQAAPEALSASADLSSKQEVVEVLPQQKRNLSDELESSQLNIFEPVIDPFAGPMKLTGILHAGFNDSMAIIESSGMSYICTVGDYIDDVWAVREIGQETVILRAHNLEVSLFLDQAPETRTLDLNLEPAPGPEDDEPEEGA